MGALSLCDGSRAAVSEARNLALVRLTRCPPELVQVSRVALAEPRDFARDAIVPSGARLGVHAQELLLVGIALPQRLAELRLLVGALGRLALSSGPRLLKGGSEARTLCCEELDAVRAPLRLGDGCVAVETRRVERSLLNGDHLSFALVERLQRGRVHPR